ncbi:hypothetical protein D3C84_830820 [compost metagenome]
MTTDTADQGSAFQASQGGRKIAHDVWIGAHGGEFAEIVVLPLAQHQAGAFQFKYGGHCLLLDTSPAVYSVGTCRKIAIQTDKDFFHIRFTCSAQATF